MAIDSERGVRQRTVVRYEPDARLFLSGRLGPGGVDLDRLTAADVSLFLARECPRRSVAGARYLVRVLRSLLRYLHVAGLISAPLRWAVPGVADMRDSSLARGLEPAAVAKLLASCDRRRTVGRRDYAIVLLCWRLGLRAGEVAGLTLDDLDWRHGELLVCGKSDRHERLPLAVDVGEALVSYLRRRPRSECRSVFVKVIAPVGPLSGKAIWGVVNAACLRAGIPPVGPHALRHTAATCELDFADLDAPLIGAFLTHLENDRGNTVRTRNARLAAIHSLYRYASIRHPEHAGSIGRVLEIPAKQHERATVSYLDLEQIGALLAAPDRNTWHGRRDHALLLTAVQTGLRVSELVGLRVGDVSLGTGYFV